jgi:hypothetical protein
MTDAQPIGTLAEIIAGARHVKAMFDALVDQGFTEDQAIKLVGAVLGGQK